MSFISYHCVQKGDVWGGGDRYLLTHHIKCWKLPVGVWPDCFAHKAEPYADEWMLFLPSSVQKMEVAWRCGRAQVAGLAISSARSWCVLATLHNHISPLSEQQGCCAAQQQRQQQHKLLELSRAAPDLLTESFVLISAFSFWMPPSLCVQLPLFKVAVMLIIIQHFKCL